MFLLDFNVCRKKRYEKFQAVSFCESTPGNLGFIRTLSSVYYSWLYKGHSLGQHLAVGLEVCQSPRSAGESTQVPSAGRGWLCHSARAGPWTRHTACGSELCSSLLPVCAFLGVLQDASKGCVHSMASARHNAISRIRHSFLFFGEWSLNNLLEA